MTNNEKSLACFLSFGEVGRTNPDHTDIITAMAVKGLCGAVVNGSGSSEDAARQATNFCESLRLDFPTLGGDLHRGIVEQKSFRDAVFAIVSEAEAKHSTDQQLESRFGELLTLTPTTLQGRVKDRAHHRLEEVTREFRDRVDTYVAQALDFESGLAFIKSVEEEAASLGLEAQDHPEVEIGRQNISTALEMLREYRKNRIFGRDARVKQGIETLAIALIGWARLLAQEEARREALDLYVSLEELAGSLKIEAEALRQRFVEVQGHLSDILSTPFPFRGEWSDTTEEPLISRLEAVELSEEALGFPLDRPSPEQVGALAGHLKELPSGSSATTEALTEGIASFLNPTLRDVFPLSVERSLNVLARRDALSDHELGQEILEDLRSKLQYSWLQISEVELSEELGLRPPILRLAVPDTDVRDRFFGSLAWQGEIRVVPELKKIILVRVDAGVNKEAIQQWATFEGAMRTAARDGYGEVIPAVLLRNADQQPTQPAS